jgi:hypothetical protein
MKIWLISLAFLMLSAATVAEGQHVGQYGGWGVFSGSSPKRCFAVAEPAGRQGSGGAAFVTFQPGRGNRAQPSFRLRADLRKGSAILLSVGGGRFQLTGQGREAFAPNAAADAAIVAAMRLAPAMTLHARTARGVRMQDSYVLAGFPTALDAAALACAPRRG